MQRLIFLLILTLILIKPTANAIFLSKVGVSALPIAYIMVAVLALIFTLFYNTYITKISPLRIFYRSMQICILLLIGIGFILWIEGYDIIGAYLFYLFISIFGILSASQFWILANQIFDAREARKYFGIIGFGAIAGGITGGYLASFISSLLQSEVIPFVAALILVLVLRYINKFSIPSKEKGAVPVAQSIASNFNEPIKLILESKHLFNIALVIAVSVFTSKLIDFQFGYFASLAYPIEEDLTVFYGFMYSTFNLAAITIQVLFTTRVIGRLGIGYSLLLLPAFLVLNAGFLIVIPGIIFATGLKLADASMKQSINKASVELIMLPVPKDIKLRTKTFLDVFIDSIATGISGIVLLLVLQAFDLANWLISALILCSSLVWFLLANRIRKEYKKVFRKSLKIKSDLAAIKVKNIEESYMKILIEGSDTQILKALNILIENPMHGLENTYLDLLKNDNPKIVTLAINLITYAKSDYSKIIVPYLDYNNQNVRIAAFEYIINHQLSLDPNFLIDKINDADSEVSIIALAAYAKEFKNDPRTLNILRVEDRLIEMVAKLEKDENVNKSVWIGILKAIGYGKFSSLYRIINKYLKSEDLEMRSHAIMSAGETQSFIYLKVLFSMMDEESVESAILSSLAKFTVKRLNSMIEKYDDSSGLYIQRNISKVFELKPNQDSIAALQLLMEAEDLEVRNNAIMSLRILYDNYPLLQIDNPLINRILIEESKYTNKILTVLSYYGNNIQDDNKGSQNEKHPLILLLKQKIDTNLRVIFELLHIKYPPENYIELYDYVKGADTELRNNAIEYVDNSLTYDLKSAIVPLLDYISTSDNIPNVENDLKTRQKIKAFLMQNKDEEIRAMALDFYGKK
ncbi:MAG: Npt1/Npt2 family nucleotide transporter [Saprospiraceae bacterium]|nr:Npt1/Npt2 family nucleotide transporter [Saprospiraceae bacterium]